MNECSITQHCGFTYDMNEPRHYLSISQTMDLECVRSIMFPANRTAKRPRPDSGDGEHGSVRADTKEGSPAAASHGNESMAGQGLDGEVDGKGKSCGTDAVTPSVNAEQHAVSSCLIDMPILCSAIRDIVRAELDNFRQSMLTTLVSLNNHPPVVYGTNGKRACHFAGA
jgi:hypothetical protein